MVIWGMVYYYLPTLFEIIWVSFGVVEDWHRAWRFFFSMRVIFFVPSWSHWIVELSLQSPCLFVKQCLCWSIHDLRSSNHPKNSDSSSRCSKAVFSIPRCAVPRGAFWAASQTAPGRVSCSAWSTRNQAFAAMPSRGSGAGTEGFCGGWHGNLMDIWWKLMGTQDLLSFIGC